ncbi:MAG: DMT family transporter [Alkalilacustris sp.]
MTSPPGPIPATGAAHARALLAMAAWGQTIPLYAILLGTFDALTLSLLRYLVGVPMIAGLALAWGVLWPRPAGRDALRLTALGCLGMGGLVTLSTLGLALSDPVTAVFVAAASPLIHTTIAVVVFRERMAPGAPAALALAVAGVVLITLDGALGRGEGRPGFRGGEVLLLCASCCWAWYSLQARRWFPATSDIRLTAWSMIVCLPFLGVLWALGWVAGVAAPPVALPSVGVMVLLVWVVGTSACVGVVLWHGAVGALGGSASAVYLALPPMFGLLLGLAFGFTPSPLQLMGGALVISAALRMYLRRLRA